MWEHWINLLQRWFPVTLRSSHQRCSIQKGVLRNLTKFTWKHLCQSLVFNKVAGLRPATLLKKRLWHRCFYCEFCEISRNTFFTEHIWTTSSRLWRKFLERTAIQKNICEKNCFWITEGPSAPIASGQFQY